MSTLPIGGHHTTIAAVKGIGKSQQPRSVLVLSVGDLRVSPVSSVVKLVSAVAIVLLASACERPATGAAAPPPQPTVAWHTLASWSGRGSRQTESFSSESGALRVRWTTSPIKDDKKAADGMFRVTAHSAISGRMLEQAVDETGPGSGVGYVNQDPRMFYFVVESDHLDWTFSVEEGIAVTVTGR